MPVVSYIDGQVIGESSKDVSVPLVVYLHGWGRSRKDFKKIAESCPGVCLDLPGFGVSPLPSGVIGAEGYADLLAQVVREASSDPVILVGHSFGGRVALVLASKYPELVKHLILAGVPLYRKKSTGKPPLKYRVIRKLDALGVIPKSFLEKQRQKRGSADYKAATGLLRKIFVKLVNESYDKEIESLQCPVSLIWGEKDTAASVEMARKAAKVIVGSTLIEHDCGHDVHLAHPKTFIDEIQKVIV